ncbi:MAG: sulfatase-like hydrolase/transferase [Candidatus Hydrogenedentes bacterium]|nr:sulfatase-like hydrolase/transferase [Candidatus Hydrogenedentota bacterium]
MRRLNRIGTGVALIGLALLSLLVAGLARAEERPNILFIMTDDQGPWAWGGGGHPDAITPNLDRLRSEGVHLANYFVTTPVCSPARASMLSSRYSTELGITDYIPPDGENGLDPALPVWPRALDEAGYRTAHIGKWHVGELDQYLPKHFGYDYFAGFRHGPGTSKDPKVEFDGEIREIKGYTPDILTDLAMDFIARDDSAPFLVSLHYWAPHANTAVKTPDGDRTWHPLSDADWDLFKEREITLPEPRHPELDVPRAIRMTREYLASVHSVDRNLGRLFAALDARGLRDNTIVVFTSDHGYNMAHHGIWHKGNGRWLLVNNQGSRPNLWDTSLRAPAIIRWPRGIEAGSTINQTTSNLDWFPSLLSLTGVPMPAGALIRGQDFAPLLRGQAPVWNDAFFVQYDQRLSLDGSGNLRAYRTPRWKLVRDYRNAGQDEFYDLASDPGELNNLIESADPEVQVAIAGLEQALRAAMARVNDPALIPPRAE